MSNNDIARARITAIVAELEQLKHSMGDSYVSDPLDAEALDVVRRIERKLAGRKHARTNQNTAR